MKQKTIKIIFSLSILLLFTYLVDADLTTNVENDPFKAVFILEDVENFIEVLNQIDLSQSDDILEGLLEKKYFKRGTPGLKIFIEKYGLSSRMLLKAIRQKPDKYKSLEKTLNLIKLEIPEWKKAYAKLKKYIPSAVFPPTYFLVGAYRGIGSGSTEGPLLTIEKWIPPLKEKTTTLVHEMTHIQQLKAQGYQTYIRLFGEDKSLLGLCIREGTAVYFAYLVTGTAGDFKTPAIKYVKKHEQRLWETFQKQMMKKNTGDWLWEKSKDPDQPRDIGYAIGFLIVEAYYKNASDKAKAVQEILSVHKDYPGFLKKSGYPKRFERN
jgi:hypothetical protein